MTFDSYEWQWVPCRMCRCTCNMWSFLPHLACSVNTRDFVAIVDVRCGGGFFFMFFFFLLPFSFLVRQGEKRGGAFCSSAIYCSCCPARSAVDTVRKKWTCMPMFEWRRVWMIVLEISLELCRKVCILNYHYYLVRFTALNKNVMVANQSFGLKLINKPCQYLIYE